MSIGDIAGILGVALAVVVPIFVYLWNRYFRRPALTIEMTLNHSGSKPIAVSPRNKAFIDGDIDGMNALRIYEMDWNINMIIRNNSEYTAYYPKLHFMQDRPTFQRIDPLNELKPITNTDEVVLNGKYVKREEVHPNHRTEPVGFPPDCNEMEILLQYQNGSKVTFYTLYKHSDKTNNFFKRMPKRFKSLNHHALNVN